MSTPMPKITVDLYPAKEEFDRFVSSLPMDERVLPSTVQANLAFNAWEMYRQGLPHRDRPTCLFYFYHFLPLYREAKMADNSTLLSYSEFSSVRDITDRNTT